MRPFSLTVDQSAESDLVVARLPGTEGGSRVVVLQGSYAESVAKGQGYETLAVRSVALAPGLLLSGEADCWLEGAAEVTMIEMITGMTFDRDEAVRSVELLIMTMAAEHRGLHNAKSVIRAFANTPGKLPPFTERG